LFEPRGFLFRDAIHSLLLLLFFFFFFFFFSLSLSLSLYNMVSFGEQQLQRFGWEKYFLRHIIIIKRQH